MVLIVHKSPLALRRLNSSVCRTRRFCALLCGGLALAFSLTEARAQMSFTYTPGILHRTDTLGSDIAFVGTVRNTSASSLTLTFIRARNTLPANWQSSLCFDVCFIPTLDTVSTTARFGSSPLAPNEARPFSLRVFPTVNHGTAIVRIVARNAADPADSVSYTFTATSQTTFAPQENSAPSQFRLYQNFPNPFNATTTIQFAVPKAGFTSLKVYNLLGVEIATIVASKLQPGRYATAFHADNLPSGVYLYTLQAELFSDSRRFVLLK
jgi:hypothetical protein